MAAYCEAFNRSQRQALRRWRRAWSRGSLRSLTEPFTAAVAVPWAGEPGRVVTVSATFNLSRGGMRVAGVPARPVSTSSVAVAPGEGVEIEADRQRESAGELAKAA